MGIILVFDLRHARITRKHTQNTHKTHTQTHTHTVINALLGLMGRW